MTKPTTDDDEDDTPHAYASPACFMHEIDPAYFGLPGPPENDAARKADAALKTKAIDAEQAPPETSGHK